MHARVTRYEGAAPEAIEATLEAKKGVLPTEFGQTEGMKGAVASAKAVGCDRASRQFPVGSRP